MSVMFSGRNIDFKGRNVYNGKGYWNLHAINPRRNGEKNERAI
jgi:hypothetical protein